MKKIQRTKEEDRAKTISITIPKNLLKKISDRAKIQEISRSFFMTMILEAYISEDCCKLDEIDLSLNDKDMSILLEMARKFGIDGEGALSRFMKTIARRGILAV